MSNECWIHTKTNTHSEYVTYCFYTAKMAKRQRLNFNLCTYTASSVNAFVDSLYLVYDQEKNIHYLLIPAALATSFVLSHLLNLIN